MDLYPSKLVQPICHISSRLVVIDLQHSQIPVTDHPGQVELLQLLRQPGDGLVPGVVESQVINQAPRLGLPEQCIQRR
jgi:hypothetical protein